jgi:ABC-type spermidine/putrescine transport system permease subunit II
MTQSRGFKAFRAVGLLLFAAYFFVPLLAMFDFSTQVRGSAPGRTWDNWALMVTDEGLRSSIIASLLLALFTVVLMVALLVPTMVWVRLRVPRARGLIEFLCLLPLTIPALVIVVGISNVYSWVTYLLGDSAQGMRKPCDELKGEIEAKIKKNGVEKFTLDIVEKDAQADGKVVGTCDGGSKKIVYKRGG